MTEMWLPVAGFEGGYEVSTHGRVRSLDRVVTRSDGLVKHFKGRILSTDRRGRYPSVSLTYAGKTRAVRVHTLVLETFVGSRPAGMEACHWDGDEFNCALTNLRWDTPSANNLDKRRHGTANAPKRKAARCRSGRHEFTPENTYRTARGYRLCRACNLEGQQRFREKARR